MTKRQRITITLQKNTWKADGRGYYEHVGTLGGVTVKRTSEYAVVMTLVNRALQVGDCDLMTEVHVNRIFQGFVTDFTDLPTH